MATRYSADDFFAMCEEYFGFLLRDYSYRIIEIDPKCMGYKFVLGSDMTIISICYDMRDDDIFIHFYDARKRPPRSFADAVGFSIDQLAKARMRNKLPIRILNFFLSTKRYSEKYLRASREFLLAYANDVLRGDFSKVDIPIHIPPFFEYWG